MTTHASPRAAYERVLACCAHAMIVDSFTTWYVVECAVSRLTSRNSDRRQIVTWLWRHRRHERLAGSLVRLLADLCHDHRQTLVKSLVVAEEPLCTNNTTPVDTRLSVTQAVSVTGWRVILTGRPAGRWRWVWSKWRGRHTLRCQPARSRRWAVEVRVFTLHTGAGWAWWRVSVRPRLGRSSVIKARWTSW